MSGVMTKPPLPIVASLSGFGAGVVFAGGGGENSPAYSPLYPMRKVFLYLVAIMDWHSRKVLS